MTRIFCLSILFALLFQFFSSPVLAEGRCPPGQYPIGDRSTLGCAPIPYYQQGRSETQMPVPRPVPDGQWLLTWGAIAVDAQSGNAGVSTGEPTREVAERVAQEECAGDGSAGCAIAFSYFHQCAAVAKTYRGENWVGGVMTFSSGKSEGVASKAAVSDCLESNPGKSCKVAYVDCSKPHYRKF